MITDTLEEAPEVIDADIISEEPIATETIGSVPPTPVINEDLELAIVGEEGTFTLTATGIRVNENMTYDTWKDGFKFFKWADQRLKQGFADYVQYGTLKFGKEKAQMAMEQMELDLPMVKMALEINSVPPELRKPGLDAEHYVVLARSDATLKEKKKWAEVASIQKLSASQLKASMAAGEVISPAAAKQRQTGILSFKGIRQEFDLHLSRIGGAEGIRKMSAEAQADILEDLKAFHDLYVELTSKPIALKPRGAKKKAKTKKAKK
jgi:hypothetical protein